MGCVVLEKYDDDVDRPIGYWSEIMNYRKRSLDTTQGECLDVI